MLRRIDKRIAVQAAETDEFRIGQAGDQRKDAALFRISHLGLKSNEIVKRLLAVLLAQLHHRVRTPAGAWVDQTYCAHGPERQSFSPAIGHFFNRHAAFEGNETLEAVRRRPRRAEQRADKTNVCLTRPREMGKNAARLGL